MTAPSVPSPHNDPEYSDPVRVLDHLRLYAAVTATVTNSSQTLAEILSEALQTDVGAVTVTLRGTSGTVHQNPAGAATTSNARLITASDGRGESETFVGSKAELDLLELITASGTVDVDVRQYVSRRIS